MRVRMRSTASSAARSVSRWPRFSAAKEDGRLPMLDHNTRIIVFGDDASQARDVAVALAKNAFSNVMFYAGSIDDLRSLRPDHEACEHQPFDKVR
jgi:hypothetical protein